MIPSHRLTRTPHNSTLSFMGHHNQKGHDYDALHRYWEASHQSASPIFSFRTRLVRDLMPAGGEGKVALDAGCGTGVYTKELLERGYNVDAFDGSPYAVDFLESELTSAQRAAFRAQVCDLFSYEPERGPYDLIIFSEVLEHIPDDTAALYRLVGMLADNGLLLLTVPLGPELYGAEDRFSGHERRYRLTELRGRIQRANLKPISVQVYGFPLLYLYLFAKKLLLKESDLEQVSQQIRSSQSKKQVLRSIMKVLIGIDRLFMWTKKGIGVVLLAKKITLGRANNEVSAAEISLNQETDIEKQDQ